MQDSCAQSFRLVNNNNNISQLFKYMKQNQNEFRNLTIIFFKTYKNALPQSVLQRPIRNTCKSKSYFLKFGIKFSFMDLIKIFVQKVAHLYHKCFLDLPKTKNKKA